MSNSEFQKVDIADLVKELVEMLYAGSSVWLVRQDFRQY